jgi:hypothetical protein
MATEEARALNRRGTNYGRDTLDGRETEGYTRLSRVTTPRGSLRLSTLLEVLSYMESSQQEYNELLPGRRPGQRRRRHTILGQNVRNDNDGGQRRGIFNRAVRVLKSLLMTGARLMPNPRLARHTDNEIFWSRGKEQWRLYHPTMGW